MKKKKKLLKIPNLLLLKRILYLNPLLIITTNRNRSNSIKSEVEVKIKTI